MEFTLLEKLLFIEDPFSAGQHDWFYKSCTPKTVRTLLWFPACFPAHKAPSEMVSVFNPCHAEQITMPCPLLAVNQSDYLIQVVDTNSHSNGQTVQIQISLQRQGISRFSRTRVKGKHLLSLGDFFSLYSRFFFRRENNKEFWHSQTVY